jgi:hypothetical protein
MPGWAWLLVLLFAAYAVREGFLWRREIADDRRMARGEPPRYSTTKDEFFWGEPFSRDFDQTPASCWFRICWDEQEFYWAMFRSYWSRREPLDAGHVPFDSITDITLERHGKHAMVCIDHRDGDAQMRTSWRFAGYIGQTRYLVDTVAPLTCATVYREGSWPAR